MYTEIPSPPGGGIAEEGNMDGKKAGILEMQVEGMTCGHCEKTVKTALEGVVGA